MKEVGLGKKLTKSINEVVQKIETVLLKIPEHNVKVDEVMNSCKGNIL